MRHTGWSRSSPTTPEALQHLGQSADRCFPSPIAISKWVNNFNFAFVATRPWRMGGQPARRLRPSVMNGARPRGDGKSRVRLRFVRPPIAGQDAALVDETFTPRMESLCLPKELATCLAATPTSGFQHSLGP